MPTVVERWYSMIGRRKRLKTFKICAHMRLPIAVCECPGYVQSHMEGYCVFGFAFVLGSIA